MIDYITKVGITLSILLNVMLGGELNQTFSARNHGWKKSGSFHMCWLIDLLLGKGHCLERWINYIIIKEALNANSDLNVKRLQVVRICNGEGVPLFKDELHTLRPLVDSPHESQG